MTKDAIWRPSAVAPPLDGGQKPSLPTPAELTQKASSSLYQGLGHRKAKKEKNRGTKKNRYEIKNSLTDRTDPNRAKRTS